MSRLDKKCDKCDVSLKDDEGKYYSTGAWICEKCFKELTENYERIVRQSLQRDILNDTMTQRKVVNKDEKKEIKKVQKKNWFK